MHSLPTNYEADQWHGWNGPLTEGIDKITESFLLKLTSTNTSPTHTPTDNLPEHARFIAHTHLNNGGLGLLYPSHRAAPDFIITMTSAIRYATSGFRPSIDLEPTRLHQSITNLFDQQINTDSTILKR